MNGKIKTKFAALFAVALMITVCVVPVVGNEDVQAASAAPEGVSGIEIQLFTEDSTDFSDMVYCSCDYRVLPNSVDANEWMWQNGLWININENSEYFGTYLRYGQTGLTNEQIVEMSSGENDEGKEYDWLPMIQISYKYTQDHYVSISVSKDSETPVVDDGNMKVVKNNVVYNEVEAISTFKLVESENPQPAFSADSNTDATGLYDVEVSIDGIVVEEQTVDYFADGSYLTISATVTDGKANGQKLTDKKTVVAYTIDGVAHSKNVDEDGIFSIKVRPGSVVAITGISYPGDAYTFTGENGSYSYGTVTENNNSMTFKANEKTGSLTVKSENTAIVGAEVSMSWWYQYVVEGEGSEPDTYDISENVMEGGVEGEVNVLGVSDKNGVVTYTYVIPDLSEVNDDDEDGDDYYKSPEAFLIAVAEDAEGYTFDVADPDEDDAEELEDNIKGFAGITVAKSGAKLVAEEDSFSVTVTINGINPDKDGNVPEVTVNYTNGIGSTLVLDKKSYDVPSKSYTGLYYVIKGNASVITPSADGYSFEPSAITKPSATANMTQSFTAESTTKIVGFVDVSALNNSTWSYSGFKTDGTDVVKFTYTVDGTQYTVPVSAVNGTATFNPTGVSSSYVTLTSVTCNGYNMNLEGGVVTVTPVKFFFYSGSINVPVAGLELTIMNDGKVAGTITTDENGTASLDIVKLGTLSAIYDGIYKISIEDSFVENTDSFYGADVKSLIPVAKVTVQYISSVNNSDVVGGAVGGLPVADASYKLAVLPGESVALKAPSIDNFEFVAWMVDGVVVSESADYTLKVDGDCHVDALYSAVHYEEPAEGLSMNVLVIGIVILILGILAVAYGIISKKQ